MSGPRTSVSRAETALVAAAWLVLVVSWAVIVLTIPSFTAVLVDVLDVAEGTGLDRADAAGLAEGVRAFVSSADADALPESFRGEPAFDERAVSHLEDVRGVVAGTRTAAGLSALALAGWVVWSGAKKRWALAARGVETGGWTVLGAVGLAGLFALVGFDRAFDAFHGLLFEEGTWLFPVDSLLIRLFPEAFWMTAGVSVGVLATGGGLVLVLAGRRLRARGEG